MKSILLIITITILAISCNSSKNTYYPQDGFVPNKETAIKIAEAVWLPIFGEDIYRQQPYKAKIENGIWKIEGSLVESDEKVIVGGTAYIEIVQKDGRIIKVSHSL